MHEPVVPYEDADMPLPPTCPEKYQVTQLKIGSRYAMPSLPLEFSRARYTFVEYFTVGDLNKSGAINTSPAVAT